MRKLLLNLIIIPSILISGCSREVSPPSDAPHLHQVYIDVSDPSKKVLERHLERAFAAQRHLPSGCLVEIFTFSTSLERIYSDAPITSTDKFFTKVSNEVFKRGSSNKETVTRTEEVVAQAASSAQGRKLCGITIITDAGMEDMSQPILDQISVAIETLADNPAVKQVVITGALAKHQLRWARWLKPLGGRGAVRPESDDAKSLPRYWEVRK